MQVTANDVNRNVRCIDIVGIKLSIKVLQSAMNAANSVVEASNTVGQ